MEIIILNQSDKERHTLYDTAYTWSLKYDTSELIYKAETDSQT